jgi:hypothetical protein
MSLKTDNSGQAFDDFVTDLSVRSGPVLRGRFVSADHVFADAAFSDVDAEFQ